MSITRHDSLALGAAVLGAALLHAVWNSLVKSAGDKFMGSARVALWSGVVAAPRATPANVVDKLATTIVAIDTDPNFQARLKALGIDPAPMNTAEFGNFIADETEKWSKVIKFANVKPE